MVHCPTVYDVAYRAGLTTAQVDWVAINDAPTITWAFPERAKPSGPLVREMIAKGVITSEDISNQGHPSIVWRDQIWTKAGALAKLLGFSFPQAKGPIPQQLFTFCGAGPCPAAGS